MNSNFKCNFSFEWSNENFCFTSKILPMRNFGNWNTLQVIILISAFKVTLVETEYLREDKGKEISRELGQGIFVNSITLL